MYNTKETIVKLAKNSEGIAADSIIKALGKNASGVFRHLQKLVQTKKLVKIGKPPKVLYYYPNNMNHGEKQNSAANWALTGDRQLLDPDWLCPTRDVFQARQEKLLKNLRGLLPENSLYLLVGAAGEIGNNSFDHNLGSWRDTAGVLFSLDEKKREIILADRGQGILATLKRVRPQTAGHLDALKAAFTETISGRYPEKRGNGLKFVKKAVEENNLRLSFYSGDALCQISGANMDIIKSPIFIPGTLAIINF
jgi:hypothetical protein